MLLASLCGCFVLVLWFCCLFSLITRCYDGCFDICLFVVVGCGFVGYLLICIVYVSSVVYFAVYCFGLFDVLNLMLLVCLFM